MVVTRTGNDTVLVGSVSGAVELDMWKKDLAVSVTLEKVEAPVSSAVRAKKAGIADRTKKNLVTKTAGSSLGQKVCMVRVTF